MNFRKIDPTYRPIPFWSWNEKLNAEETRRQVRVHADAGIGGYFMHARGGLLTEYMGEEWFDNVTAAVEEGESLGMRSWAYDENGWPSGFGDGRVLALGEDYQQKNLLYCRTEDYTGEPSRVLLERDGYTYYYGVNELYVDLLSPDVTDAFIREVHEVYYERYGNRIEGFFTDEPQLLRLPGFPYSVVTFPEFQKRYGYDLRDKLPSLFHASMPDCARVRFDFWKMTTELFSENFFKRIYDWCEAHGYKLTGHLVCEETYEDIVRANGAIMPHYEYFHIPGIDWLGRPVDDWLTRYQIGSAAAQLGKRYVLTESFALTGHNVSHGELKRIFEAQLVHGVNLLCPHLEGYSNRGIRKRDYPTAMYYQQPWWEDAKLFFDTLSREGMIIGEGEPVADTLVIQNTSTAWTLYDGYIENYDNLKVLRECTNQMMDVLRILSEKHILFHLGDETLMERHARVEDGKIIIGKMSYSRVVVPKVAMLFDNTRRLLDDFVAQGGQIIAAEDIPANPVTAPSRLSYTMRRYPNCTVHLFVNTDPTEITADISVGNLVIDTATGDTHPFFGRHTFGPYESLFLVDTGEQRANAPTPCEGKTLSLLGKWQVKSATENSLVLDRCDYYIDGELIEKNGYVLDILPRVNEYRRPVRLHQKYTFLVDELPEGDVYLATETPEIFDITVNGTRLDKRDCGFFRDISFRRLPITEHIRLGVNTVEFDSTVCQSERAFRHLDKSWEFETMSNCLSYDIEIEQIYIVGNFGVSVLGDITELPKDAYRVRELATSGGYSFAIRRAPDTVTAESLDLSGYPEFAGALTLTRTVNLADTAYRVKLTGRGMNSVHVTVNGKYLGARMFGPYDLSISDALRVGENEIEIKIVNNLRNIQGPSHLKEGETFFANRNAFYRESNVFNHPRGTDEHCHDVLDIWDDDVCLVHFGLTDGISPATTEESPW